MAPLAIRAHGITRAYGDRLALDDFTLEVPPGGVFGVLGPNGSGKSTFIAMLAAMEKPATGTLEVLGQPPARALLAKIGTVFQENASDPLMRTGEYLRFAGRLFGLQGDELTRRIAELLTRFGLAERAGDPVGSLSGGMRRRLEVARALLHRPELLILDEPTTGVDVEERDRLWQTLGAPGESLTILLATNDLHEADRVCERVAFIQRGRVIASGTPAELKTGLRAESVRIELQSAEPTLLERAAAVAGAVESSVDGGTISMTTDDAATLVPRLFDALPGAIRSVNIAQTSLEDAYVRHVGRRAGGAK